MILTFLTALNFGSFAYSVIGVFAKAPDQDLGKYRALQMGSIITWIVGLWATATTQADPAALVLVGIIQVLCLIGFWSTSAIVKRNRFTIAYSKDQPQKLVEEGLYRWVRHPFYMIYLCSYGSIGLLLLNPYATACAFLMGMVYYDAARTEEAKFLQTSLRDQYLSYRNRTFMFAPRFFS